MDIRYIFYLLLTAQLCQSCWECKPDKYGEILELEVPITTYPAKDTFELCDTLWIKANFEKEVRVYNTTNTIRLDSFNFFALFGFSEISDTIENYLINIDTIVEIGQVGYLPLHDNVIAYPIEFFEDDLGYHLAFKIVLKTRGKFWLSISSAEYIYQESYYDHPVLYTCENTRRDRVSVYFRNLNTTPEGFNQIFRTTNVDYLIRLMDYDRYAKAGSISIVVE